MHQKCRRAPVKCRSAGGANWAAVAALVETCKLNAADPQRYLIEFLHRLVNGGPQARIDEFMAWCWAEAQSARTSGYEAQGRDAPLAIFFTLQTVDGRLLFSQTDRVSILVKLRRSATALSNLSRMVSRKSKRTFRARL